MVFNGIQLIIFMIHQPAGLFDRESRALSPWGWYSNSNPDKFAKILLNDRLGHDEKIPTSHAIKHNIDEVVKFGSERHPSCG